MRQDPTPENHQKDAILTIEELSKYLKISITSIYKLAQTGRIPATKVLTKWRFDRREIDELLKSGNFNQYHTSKNLSKAEIQNQT